VIGFHRFGGLCCVHLQGEVNGAWIEIQVAVFLVMTPCSDAVVYQRFGGPVASIFRVNSMGLG